MEAEGKTFLKKAAEASVHLTVITVCIAIMGAVGIYVTSHVTCVDFIQKWCVFIK